METSEFTTRVYRFSLIFSLIVCLFFSCSDSEEREVEMEIEAERQLEMRKQNHPMMMDSIQLGEDVFQHTEEAANPDNAAETSGNAAEDFNPDSNEIDYIAIENQNRNNEKEASQSLSEYTVSLSTDQELKLQETGEFTVWIGRDEYLPALSEEKISDNTTIPSEIGQFAKITPHAPDFEVEPLEYKCIKIHPSGSEVRFKFQSKKKGTFKISANIELYEEKNCEGTPVPKTTKTLSVKVDVDGKAILREKINELLTIAWDKFLSFWGILITTIFGAVIIFIRGKLKGKSDARD